MKGTTYGDAWNYGGAGAPPERSGGGFRGSGVVGRLGAGAARCLGSTFLRFFFVALVVGGGAASSWAVALPAGRPNDFWLTLAVPKGTYYVHYTWNTSLGRYDGVLPANPAGSAYLYAPSSSVTGRVLVDMEDNGYYLSASWPVGALGMSSLSVDDYYTDDDVHYDSAAVT